MGVTIINERNAQIDQKSVVKPYNKASAFLHAWELYPILLIAAFLRLYRIDTVIFADDQAVVFQMAHDAFVHGLWPITSNRASLGNINFPLVVYFFMVPAAFSSNPLWAEVMVGLLNTIAVLLAYFFTRRYYGRLAGTIVGFLYATSVMAIAYSGDIWPQNLLPPLVILFLFCLFKGVVERRQGWLFPAILLLGILYQLHGSSLLLAGLLLASCIFAFKTIRWHEILLATVVLGVMCSPYLFWEWQNHFADVTILLKASKTPAHLNLDTWGFYKSFLSPYIQAGTHIDLLPTDPHSVLVASPLRHLQRPLRLEYVLMPWLLLCGVATTALLTLWPQSHQQTGEEIAGTANRVGGIRGWLSNLWATPDRQGLLLLLIWQVLLPATLLHHSIILFPHYFIIFLPGQFILIGLFIAKAIDFVQSHRPKWKRIAHYALASLTVCIIAAQLIGSVSALIDRVNGNFDGQAIFPAVYNDLSSMQHALQEADQLAQKRHIHRIYVATNDSTASAMHYLMEQERTPIMAFDDQHCVVLPSASAGPVILLSQPSDPQVNAILDHYATATLVDQPRRLGGAPFDLFVLTARLGGTPIVQTFTSDIHLLDLHALQVQNKGTNDRWLVTHWSATKSQKHATRTFYTVHFDIRPDGKPQSSNSINCSTTSLWADDQYFTLQSLGPHEKVPTFVTVQAYSFTNYPLTFPLGPLTLSTFIQKNSPQIPLRTADGKTSVTLRSF
jgi:4-amino-4-deoxy-L-arabinose transferase-like glycosyltransferase